MKKITIGNVFYLIAAICTLIGSVIYYQNANGTYYHDFKWSTMLLGLGCLAAEIIGFICIQISKEKRWTDVIYPICTVLLGFEAVTFIGARVESAGIILGSDLEAGNALASQSLTMAFVGIGFFAGALLILGIAGCMRQTKTALQGEQK